MITVTRKITSEDMTLVKLQQVPMVKHGDEFELHVKLTGIERENGEIIVFTQPVSGMLQRLWADQLKGKIVVLDYVANYKAKEEENDESESA